MIPVLAIYIRFVNVWLQATSKYVLLIEKRNGNLLRLTVLIIEFNLLSAD